MRAAVLYESSHGQTAKIADAMGVILRERGYEVVVQRCRASDSDRQIAQADRVIIGSSVHAGRHSGRAAGLIRRAADALNARPSAFFSVSMQASSDEPPQVQQMQQLADTFVAQCGWRPGRTVLFGGGLPYTRYNSLLRFVMKRISKSQGGPTDTSRDHEFTDWDAVREFTVRFAETDAAQADTATGETDQAES